jgi:hypothetical protein
MGGRNSIIWRLIVVQVLAVLVAEHRRHRQRCGALKEWLFTFTLIFIV